MEVVCGDFSKPLFGMASEEYEALLCSVTMVVHCGAAVNLKKSYSALRSANVGGTLQVIRFCFESKAPPRLIFISTTDVLPKGEYEGKLEPYHLPKEALEAESGYAVSKVVGEALVVEALGRGLHGGIIRLGMIGGDSRTGNCNPTDFVMRLYLGIAHTRSFPEVGPQHTNVLCLPVDVAAKAIISLADSPLDHTAVNLVSGQAPLPLMELRQHLLAFKGPYAELPIVPFKEWMERVKRDAALSLWPAFSWASKLDEFPVFNQRKIPLRQAGEFLSTSILELMERGVDEMSLHRMIDFILAEPDMQQSHR